MSCPQYYDRSQLPDFIPTRSYRRAQNVRGYFLSSAMKRQSPKLIPISSFLEALPRIKPDKKMQTPHSRLDAGGSNQHGCPAISIMVHTSRAYEPSHGLRPQRRQAKEHGLFSLLISISYPRPVSITPVIRITVGKAIGMSSRTSLVNLPFGGVEPFSR